MDFVRNGYLGGEISPRSRRLRELDPADFPDELCARVRACADDPCLTDLDDAFNELFGIAAARDDRAHPAVASCE